MHCNENWNVPNSNPTRHLVGLRDPTSLWGYWWPSSWICKTPWLTLDEWDCPLDNGAKLAMGQPKSSLKKLIRVRDNIENVSLELPQENKVGQSLWVLVANTKKKIRVSVIYTLQENVAPNNELKIMYEDIREQIKIEKEEKQQMLILGDFKRR